MAASHGNDWASGAVIVPYNPADPYQQSLLATIRQRESGNDYWIGYGGTNLYGTPTDEFGFPQWSGRITSRGPTHAAGAYQFQPATWREIASRYGLNFQRTEDQDAAAWYLAQERYSRYTGGRNLYEALQRGEQQQALSTLSPTWAAFSPATQSRETAENYSEPEQYNFPATPIVSAGSGEPIQLELGSSAAQATQAAFGVAQTAWSGLLSTAENLFLRGAVIVIGIFLLMAGIWGSMKKGN